MSQAKDELVARAQDPNAELETLHQLAQNYPGLRPYIAANPRTYPALLEWLGTLGDPAVDAALASRSGHPQSDQAPQASPPAPIRDAVRRSRLYRGHRHHAPLRSQLHMPSSAV